MAVAINQQHHELKPFSRSQRCKLQSFTHLDYAMLDELSQTTLAHSLKQAIEVASIHRSVSTPCLNSQSNKIDEDYFESSVNPRIELVGGRGAPRVRALVVEVAIAMASGVDPTPVSSGLGGAYFLRSKNGDNIAVAKPMDEEPMASNNPKGFVGRMLGQPGLKRSVRVGETGVRELAAYLLDHNGFAGVPATALVKISHVVFHLSTSAAALSSTSPPYKIASIQRFVDHDFDAGELGSSGFSVASVHRIGILDVRLLNLDRHAGNILIKKHGHEAHDNYAVGIAELVPIDHGLCLPEFLDDPYFEWLHWPQASVPFSEVEVEYISNLDPFKDAELLRSELPSIRESSIRVLVLCTIFLKQAAAAGLCLADIGEMMTREFHSGEEDSSVLENVCAEAKANISNISNIDDHSDDDKSKENEGEREMFQFDEECEDNSKNVLDLGLPVLLKRTPGMAKPPKIPRFSSSKSMSRLPDANLSPLHEEEDDHANNDERDTDITENGNANDEDRDDEEDSRKVSGLTRSMSYSVRKHNQHESEDICFGEMSEGDWRSFLESFEKLLPEVFEGTKSTGLKQRLGTSCKF